ncbi:hypothetical protein GCM10027262_47610 [Nocardia tengchongensis]
MFTGSGTDDEYAHGEQLRGLRPPTEERSSDATAQHQRHTTGERWRRRQRSGRGAQAVRERMRSRVQTRAQRFGARLVLD